MYIYIYVYIYMYVYMQEVCKCLEKNTFTNKEGKEGNNI